MKNKETISLCVEKAYGICLALAIVACEAPILLEEIEDRYEGVISGTNASRREYPWQVLVIYDKSKMCSGSLLSDSWVITAAHCVYGRSSQNFDLRFGEYDLTRSEYGEQQRTITGYIAHPQFTNFTEGSGYENYNDIALLKLSSPVRITSYVSPINLASGNDGAGLSAWVTGWGRTKGDNPSSRANILQEAMLPVRPKSECDAVPSPVFTRDLVETELCVGYQNGDRGACHGDSGAPLAVRRPSGNWELIGVVNWGQLHYCGTYTVAARISSFVPWINSIIVEQKAPSADFSYATSALMVKFRDQSTDEDGYLVEWNWDFDDKNITSSEQNPIHFFSAEGTYSVKLTVTDNQGTSHSITKSVSVETNGKEEQYQGTLAKGEWDQQPGGSYYQAVAGVHGGRLTFPSGSDFRLYLYKWSTGYWVSGWEQVAVSVSSAETAVITYDGTSGFYTWLVKCNSGGGNYDFWLTRP